MDKELLSVEDLDKERTRIAREGYSADNSHDGMIMNVVEPYAKRIDELEECNKSCNKTIDRLARQNIEYKEANRWRDVNVEDYPKERWCLFKLNSKNFIAGYICGCTIYTNLDGRYRTIEVPLEDITHWNPITPPTTKKG